MLLENTKCWTLWVLLYCGLESSLGVRSRCERCVRNVTVSAPPNSPVTLPCELPVHQFHQFHQVTGGNPMTVAWTQHTRGVILEIKKAHSFHFNFRDPREGRVKVFPNRCAVGNFSIRIDQLQRSDLGQYCCVGPNGSVCSVLEFRVTPAVNHAGARNAAARFVSDNWYYLCAGAGLLLLIACVVTGVCCVKYRRSGSEDIVYENDDQIPNSVADVESEPPVKPEITSSNTPRPQPKPFYANQEEISKQLETREQRPKKQRFRYNNPIYT